MPLRVSAPSLALSFAATFAFITRHLSAIRKRTLRFGNVRALLVAAAVCLCGAGASATTYTVNSTGDTGSGSGVSGDLRYVITQANSDPGSTIDFSVTGTITLSSSLPAIRSDMTFNGPGATRLTISGAKAYQIFSITSGTVVFSNLTIANASSSSYGGGISNNSGTLTVTNCVFSGNSSNFGGGIYNYDNGSGSLTVSSSTFSGNSATSGGGGIYNYGTATVINSTFSGNSVASHGMGGAIYSYGTVTLTNSTLSANSAPAGDGGGIFNDATTLTLNNSIVAGNAATNGPDIDGPAAGAYNLIGDGDGESGMTNGTNSDQVGTGASPINPLLLPLGYYGGESQTYLPLPASPAVCAGSSADAVDASSNPLLTDQRGWPVNSSVCPSGQVDEGAVQTNYLSVTTLADKTDASPDCTSGFGTTCSLRDAIAQANTTPGDIDFHSGLTSTASPKTIVVGAGTAGDIALPTIDGQVNIIGPGANQLTVSGNHDTNLGSVFIINSGATATLYGLTIANGLTTSGTFGGGGIYNDGTLTLMASAVSGNQSTGGGPGGGIDNAGTLTVTGSTVSGNTAANSEEGGGIFSGGTLTVTDSTFANNTVTGDGIAAGGGGIANYGSFTLTSSTVSGNSAVCNSCLVGAEGGGVYLTNGAATLTLNNSIVAANTASASGAAALGADISASHVAGTGNVMYDGTASTSPYATTLLLSPLQLNGIGATVQTMIPLPASPAICAGLVSNIPSGTTTDQRGYPLQPTNGYCPSTAVDAGAVQTNYTSLAFVQQPANVAVNTAMSPAPTVQVVETDTLLSSGNTDAVGVDGMTATVALTDSDSALQSGYTQSVSGGVAAISGLTFSTAETGDSLTASLTATPAAISPAATITGTSGNFNVYTPVAPTITSASTVYFPSGEYASFTVTTTGTPTPALSQSGAYSFAVFGLTFVDNGNGTATISGVSTEVPGQSYPITITASNGVNPNATQTFMLGGDFPISFNPPSTLSATVGSVASVQLAAVGGTGALTYTISPAPPSWLTLNSSTGLLAAFPPSVSAPATYTLTATDSLGASTSANIQVIVNAAPAITTTSLPDAYQNVPYSTTIAETGGSGPPTSFTLNPAVPGFSINPTTGVLSGTATATGPIQFHISFTDEWGANTSKLLTLNVDPLPTYVVTTLTDQTDSGTTCTSGATCSLRDAITVANTSGVGNITFASGLTSVAAPGTINLGPAVTGPPALPAGTNTPLPAITGVVYITGPGANQLTVSGNHSTSVGSVFTINSGATVTLSGLTIANGNDNDPSTGGGGILNSGTLTVLDSAVSNNSDGNGGSGGGIDNHGTLTVTGSTVSGNTLNGNFGGGISNNGALTITDSTIAGNSSTGDGNVAGGGGISSYGSFTLTNSTVSGNSAVCNGCASGAGGGGIYIADGTASLTVNNSIVAANIVSTSGPFVEYADIFATNVAGTGNLAYSGANSTSPYATTLLLSPLQLNGIGATVQTMIPLPGSPAICAGLVSDIPSGFTTDERGYPLATPGYCTSGQVDAGAVQTNYTSVAFVQQPSNTLINSNMSPPPTIEVLETDTLLSSNNTDAVGSVPVTVTPSGGTYAGSPFTVTTSSTSPFLASLAGLNSSTGASGIDLATSPITVVGTHTLASVTSNSYDVLGMTSKIAVSASPSATAGSPTSLTVTAEDASGNTTPGYTGTVHFTTTDAGSGVSLPANYTFVAADNGVHTFTNGVTLVTAGNQTVSASDTVSSSITGSAPIAVSSANATHLVIPGGPEPFYTAFGFTITAEDAYGNVATSYNGTVAFTSSDPGFVNLGPITLSNGTGSQSAALKTAGTDSITATDTSNPSITGTGYFTVPPGPAVSISLLAPSSAYAGSPFSFTVTAHDLYGNVATSYTGTVHFTSTDTRAGVSLPSDYTFTAGDNGTHTFVNGATLVTVGGQTITATDSGNSLVSTSGNIAVTIPNFVVTTALDDAGNASHCTVQAASGTGTDSSCSLRDALLEAASMGSGNISFDSTAFDAPQTITLNGTASIPSNTAITGPTSGSGSTLTNLVTISGGGSASNFSIFAVGAGVTGAALSNLTLANGHVNSQGGAIANAGSLAIVNCTLKNNYAGGYTTGLGNGGGAIYNDGTLNISGSTFSGNASAPGGAITADSGSITITNSTFSGNIAVGGYAGAAIFINAGTVALNGSTFSGNTSSSGFAIFNYSTLTSANTVIAGNTGGDCGAGSPSTCPANGSNGNIVSGTPSLAPLGNYGGPTQTIIPLPGSPAICAGLKSNIPLGVATDQRGYANINTTYPGYSAGTPCVDAGAVQTSYSIAFVQQPSTVIQNAAMSPSPTVQLDENNAPFFDGADTIFIPLTLTTGPGAVTGGIASTSATTGIATYSALSISLPGVNDQLTATLSLNPALTTPLSITLAGGTFNVNSAVTQLAFSTAPASTVTAGGNAGSSVVVQEQSAGSTLVTTANDTITLTVTGPNSYTQTYTQAASGGVATFNLSSAALTAAGGYSYSASIAGNPSVSDATATESVSAAASATVSVVSGSAQASVIGAAFATPLKVSVVDRYSNPVQGATVSFTAPLSGASATFSTPAATAADGTTSVTATANGLASATAYTVSASVSGATVATFSLTNTPAATSLTVAPTSIALAYGQPVTVRASITPASILTSMPMGSVTFYDGTTPLSPAGTVASAQASYAVSVPTVGSHAYAAQYSGDTNFQQSALTSASAPLVVSKANSTLTGPTTPVSLAYGTGGTISISVTGQFSGAGIATPSGTVSYTIGSGTAQTAPIASGAATLTIPATQPAGGTSVAVSYSGDGNYNAATNINVNLSIAPATLTISAGNATRVYGTANPVFTGTVTGQQNHDSFTEHFLTAATIASPVNTYAIVPSVTGVNLADYTQVINNGTLAVAQAATSTSLAISSPSITPGQSETLRAQVLSSTTGTPSGSVSFYDGSTLLDAVPLTAGVASYSTATLAPGVTHSLSAVYSGDTNFTGSTTTSSATVTVAPLDFTMTLTGPSNLTVVPGQSVTYKVTVTPDYGSYAGTVNFAVTGLPPGATVGFSPSSIPASSGPVTVTVTITAAPATAALEHSQPPSAHRRIAPFTLAFLLLFGVGSLRRRRRALQRMLVLAVLALGCAAAALSVTGCGAPNGYFSQAPQNYSITITATAGPLQHSASVTLNVQ
jgi:CSLREA domain-containing protein